MDLSQLLIGDVILVRQNSPFSYIIRLLQTDCDYSHACLYLGQNQILTTGAKNLYWSGIVKADNYLKHQDKVAVCRKPTVNLEHLQRNLASLIGKPYATAKLLKLMFQVFRGIRIKGNPIGYKGLNETHMFCSELVANCLGYNFGKLAADSVTPENIYEDKTYDTVYEGKLYA